MAPIAVTRRAHLECGSLLPLWRARHAAAANRPRVAAERRCEPMRGRDRVTGATGRNFEVLARENPNGIPSQSPGLGREADLPRVRGTRVINPIGVSSCQGVGSHHSWVGRNPLGVDELLGIGFPRVARGAGYPGLRDGTSSRFSICLEGTSVGQQEGLPPLSSVRAEPPARGRRKGGKPPHSIPEPHPVVRGSWVAAFSKIWTRIGTMNHAGIYQEV